MSRNARLILLLGSAMLAAGAVPASGAGGQEAVPAPAPAPESAQARYEREAAASEAARLRYEQDSAAYQAELARSREAQAEYQRQLASPPAARQRAPSPLAPFGIGRGRQDPRLMGLMPAMPGGAMPVGVQAGTTLMGTPSGMTPAGAPTRTAPVSAGQRTPGVDANGVMQCDQNDPAQLEANRRDAEQMTAMLNRMATAATNMSVNQAARNGAQMAPIAPLPVLGAEVTRAFETMLNCGEQRQIEVATEQAIAGPVGTSAAWTSESRPNVSGISTVTAVEAAAPDGSQCLTVTDIVIVDGAESRAPKRMCRVPPSTRYVRA